MKMNGSTVLFLVGILLTACAAGSAESEIEVHDARLEAAAQGENSTVYMALHNHGSGIDQLTGVSSNAAEGAQLHNGTEVVEVIPLYANTEIDFSPDGYHIQLNVLKQELHVGDEIEIVLHFRDRADLTVKATVEEGSDHGHEEH
jgi:copper(I)-binding protein